MDGLHNQRLEGKKILLLVTQSKYGGAQKYILELARFFSQRNTVLIAVGEAKQQDTQFFTEARTIGIEPLVLRSLVRDISLVKAFDALFEIRKLLYKERPDFLHINSSMAGAVGACAAWTYRLDPLNKPIRVVYTAHGFVFNEPLAHKRLVFYRFIEKISAGWKGAIITVSSYDRDQAIAHKIAPAGRMVVIHNGIDLNMVFASKADARKQLSLPAEATIVGTIASLYPTKGLSYLVEAANLIKQQRPNLIFVIIGDGPECEKLEKLIESKNLSSSVLLLGAHVHAHELVTAFNAFVLPSVKEGFPYTLLEAGLAGVPIVATRVGGIPELITHGEHGLLVPPSDPNELTHAVLSLLNDSVSAARTAQRLQARIRSEFSLEKTLSETESLYLRFYQSPPPKNISA